MIKQSESLAALAPALAKAQSQIKVAVKDAVNPHFRSKYADLGAVWDACRDALTSNGLSIVQMPVDSEPGRVALCTMLLHSSGEFLTSTVSTKITKDDPQGVGSALTYLRRYALAACVGVVADEDDDGNAASQRNGQSQQQARPAAPQSSRAAAVAPRAAEQQVASGGTLATERQKQMLQRMANERSLDLGTTVQEQYHCNLADLTMDQAGQLISEWQRLPRVLAGR